MHAFASKPVGEIIVIKPTKRVIFIHPAQLGKPMFLDSTTKEKRTRALCTAIQPIILSIFLQAHHASEYGVAIVYSLRQFLNRVRVYMFTLCVLQNNYVTRCPAYAYVIRICGIAVAGGVTQLDILCV